MSWRNLTARRLEALFRHSEVVSGEHSREVASVYVFIEIPEEDDLVGSYLSTCLDTGEVRRGGRSLVFHFRLLHGLNACERLFKDSSTGRKEITL